MEAGVTPSQGLKAMSTDRFSESGKHLVEQVVGYIRNEIEGRTLHPGDRLPPERDLARKLDVSRATLRSAIGYLAAMGVLTIRHGVGTFVADGPLEIGKLTLSMLGALHDFQSWQMFEARLTLESSLAALAAKRGQERDFAALAEEVAEMFATCDDPEEYLIHDVLFHRTIARASGNPILAALMETVAAAVYDARRETAKNTRNLRESAEVHREIYRAIRSRDGAKARELMEQHLKRAEIDQINEEAQRSATASAAPQQNPVRAPRAPATR
jgi:GntR family transcriptional regulator, transcriptional repressor for pyruvate dehydrogenase complex